MNDNYYISVGTVLQCILHSNLPPLATNNNSVLFLQSNQLLFNLSSPHVIPPLLFELLQSKFNNNYFFGRIDTVKTTFGFISNITPYPLEEILQHQEQSNGYSSILYNQQSEKKKQQLQTKENIFFHEKEVIGDVPLHPHYLVEFQLVDKRDPPPSSLSPSAKESEEEPFNIEDDNNSISSTTDKPTAATSIQVIYGTLPSAQAAITYLQHLLQQSHRLSMLLKIIQFPLPFYSIISQTKYMEKKVLELLMEIVGDTK